MEASEGGKIPIVCDTSPCLSQIKVHVCKCMHERARALARNRIALIS